LNKLRRTLIALGLAAVAVLPLLAFGGASVSAAPATIKVKAGNGEKGYTVNAFLPAAATVTTGDTVHWDFLWNEPHTVTFGTPAGDPTAVPSPFPAAAVPYDGTGSITSGLLGTNWPSAPGTTPGPTAFEVKFTKAGTYNYVCAIHPNMKAAITVVDSGTVSTQGALDERGTVDYTTALTALKAVAAGLAAKPVAVTTKAGGASEYTLAVSGETDKGDVQQYFPPAANIKEGDTIVWKNDTHTPHSVTFLPPPAGDPFAALPVKPAGGYAGTGTASSGIIGIGFPNGQVFDMAFTKAGSYPFICLLHANQGMTGIVNVAAAPVAPAPPKTGSGVEEGGTAGLWLVAGVIALAVAVSGLSVAAVRR
jgi:plastocyanin